MSCARSQKLGERTFGFRIGGAVGTSVMKKSVGILADDLFGDQAERACGGTIDEDDGTGEVHAVDSFGSGIENEDEFFANLFAFGDFASHELAHLAADAHQKIAELFVHGYWFVAEEDHDAENALKKTERNGKGAADSGGSCGRDAGEVIASGYVFNPQRRASLPDASRKAFAGLEVDAVAEGLKLQMLG